jgi:hypothetical protein
MTRGFLISAAMSLAVIVISVCSILIAANEPASRSDSPRYRLSASSDSTPVVRVAVLNGCGSPGVAAAFVRSLRERGFDVVNGIGGNADSFDFPRSVVVDRRGNRAYADSVARCLGIRTVLSQRSGNPYLIEDIAVVLGRDWNTLYPACVLTRGDPLLIPEKEKSE